MPYFGGGQGGRSNAYPGRGYPETSRDAEISDFTGGARGPAALPARVLSPYPSSAPPNMVPPGLPFPFGPQPVTRRGPAWAGPKYSPGNQNQGQADGTNWHNSIAWSRPFFANTAGPAGYKAPTQQPSWTADSTVVAPPPRVPFPIGRKRIASATVNEEYGSTRILFALFPRDVIQDPGKLQGARWMAQAKTMGPYQPRLTQWGLAGSYGQQTTQLRTAPAQVGAGPASGMGSY